MAESTKKPFRYKSTILEETRKELASTQYQRFDSVTKKVDDLEQGTSKNKPVILFIKKENKFVEGYGYQTLEKVTEIDVELFNLVLDKARGK